MAAKQNPTEQQNLHQWNMHQTAPRERMMAIESEYVTIYGEAPSGAHVAEPRWLIWRETKDASGRITVDYAQEGSNTLYWIYHSIAFDPVVDLSGNPYFIELDNDCVFDGMGAGLPVANITVGDVDDVSHTLEVVHDPYNKFQIVGSVLYLADSVQLVDIAYPIKIRATDDDSNSFDQVFAIYVKDPAPPVPADFVGELNLFEEDDTVTATSTVTLIDYTVPPSRELRLRIAEVFGTNRGDYIVEVDGEILARKGTYYTYYETAFDFENFELPSGSVLKIYAENKGINTGRFNARLRGYQYAV